MKKKSRCWLKKEKGCIIEYLYLDTPKHKFSNKGRKFSSNKEIIEAMESWFPEQQEISYKKFVEFALGN